MYKSVLSQKNTYLLMQRYFSLLHLAGPHWQLSMQLLSPPCSSFSYCTYCYNSLYDQSLCNPEDNSRDISLGIRVFLQDFTLPTSVSPFQTHRDTIFIQRVLLIRIKLSFVRVVLFASLTLTTSDFSSFATLNNPYFFLLPVP